MASLYELTEDYKELLAMAEDEELDSELLADTLEGIEGSIEEKAEACRTGRRLHRIDQLQ